MKMKRMITHKEALKIIGDLKGSLPRDECRTCECYQGFLVQIGIEASEDIRDLTDPLKVKTFEMHGCLGCDPCPPADAFMESNFGKTTEH
jgi:hypothetical protein